jgi:hypothetical protein
MTVTDLMELFKDTTVSAYIVGTHGETEADLDKEIVSMVITVELKRTPEQMKMEGTAE